MSDKCALSIMAHPDDCEFMCAGTLALLHQKGWKIHIATMTPGDCGSVTLSREEISAIRKKEARNSAIMLGGEYTCLECEDVFIMYDRPTLLKVIALIRKVKPQIVFAPSPSDYMADHETTSRLVQTACFAAGIPNIETKGIGAYFQIPALLYCDAMDGKDMLGNAIDPSFIVNITPTFERKRDMLACHESQRNWLKEHHGVDEYLLSMQRFAEDRGKLAKCTYGEGFRMHLGHSFPSTNPLIQDLPKEVIKIR